VHRVKGKFWASEHAAVATCCRRISVDWFAYLVEAMNLKRHSETAAQPGLALERVGRLPVPCPPLDEQSAIAAFLDRETAKIDELIAKKRRFIELLEIKRRTIIEHAVTRGLSKAPRMKTIDVGWLNSVPAHWRIHRIANLFRDTAEPGNEELPILSVSIHAGISDEQIADEDMDRKVLRSEDKSKYIRVIPGDLVYNMMRAWQGGFGAAKVEGMVSPAYVVARPVVKVSTQFVEHLLRTPNAVEEMRRNSYGVADFRLRLYWDQFKNIRVALPPIAEAEDICKYIEGISLSVKRVTEVTLRTIGALQQLRASLITAAVTGQIDVRNHRTEVLT
jgi:type I restriction enzyme S subunit